MRTAAAHHRGGLHPHTEYVRGRGKAVGLFVVDNEIHNNTSVGAWVLLHQSRKWILLHQSHYFFPFPLFPFFVISIFLSKKKNAHRNRLVFSLVVVVVEQQRASTLGEDVDAVTELQHSLKRRLQVLRQPSDHRVLHRHPTQRKL